MSPMKNRLVTWKREGNFLKGAHYHAVTTPSFDPEKAKGGTLRAPSGVSIAAHPFGYHHGSLHTGTNYRSGFHDIEYRINF